MKAKIYYNNIETYADLELIAEVSGEDLSVVSKGIPIYRATIQSQPYITLRITVENRPARIDFDTYLKVIYLLDDRMAELFPKPYDLCDKGNSLVVGENKVGEVENR